MFTGCNGLYFDEQRCRPSPKQEVRDEVGDIGHSATSNVNGNYHNG